MNNVTDLVCMDCEREYTSETNCDHCGKCEDCCECVFCQSCDKVFSNCSDDIDAVDICIKECCDGGFCVECCSEATLEALMQSIGGDTTSG